MDINDLLHREQVSLAKANTAIGSAARRAHHDRALGLAAELRDGGYPHRKPIAWPIAAPSENPDRGRAAA